MRARRGRISLAQFCNARCSRDFRFKLRAKNAHVALVYAEECVEHIADDRDGADRGMDAEVGEHPSKRELRNAEVPCLPNDVGRKKGRHDIADARNEADDCVNADALLRPGDEKSRIEKIGDELQPAERSVG